MIVIDDLETDKGRNQIGILKRDGDTYWGSHLSSFRSLVLIFYVTCFVLFWKISLKMKILLVKGVKLMEPII